MQMRSIDEQEELLHEILTDQLNPIGLKAGSFSGKRAYVYRAARDLILIEHRPIDLLTMAAMLDAMGRLGEVTHRYLAGLFIRELATAGAG